jgi:hypothetical protein
LVTLLAASLWSPAAARASQGFATQACANPDIPASILAGRAAVRGSPVMPTIVVRAGRVALRLAVADSEHRRERGLMCVTALRPRGGMLFVFAGDAIQTFWMKNTLIPLDMVWVRADGRIDEVAAEVPASTLTTPDDAVARRSGRGRYVIELAGGEARRDGIAVGRRVLISRGGYQR